MKYQIFKHVFESFEYQRLSSETYQGVIGHHQSPTLSFQNNFQLVQASNVRDHGNYGYCFEEVITILINPIFYWQVCMELGEPVSQNQIQEGLAKYLFEMDKDFSTIHFVTVPLGTASEGKFAKRFGCIDNIIRENPITNEDDEEKINNFFFFPSEYQNYMGFIEILDEVGEWNEERTAFTFDEKTVRLLDKGQQWIRIKGGNAKLTEIEVNTIHIGIKNFYEYINAFQDNRYAQKLFGKYLFEQGIQTLPLNLIF